ncbi:hypothetical protein Tco_0842753 [Tanacetum coccineum]|uniref:C2H2-type domain-containing protein n=1 Tax=Tanacetum coccineum TaxID=301880 RepID=A0ABQ5B116_9ASTR
MNNLSDTYVTHHEDGNPVEPASKQALGNDLTANQKDSNNQISLLRIVCFETFGDSLNLPDHRIHKDGDGDALSAGSRGFITTCSCSKTYYKHQRFKNHEAQEFKGQDLCTTSDIQVLPSKYQVYQGDC